MPAKKRAVLTYVGPKKAAPTRKKRTAYEAPV
jgi:hypothetical protein